MEIRTAYKEDFSELLSFYNRMCSVLGGAGFSCPRETKAVFRQKKWIRESIAAKAQFVGIEDEKSSPLISSTTTVIRHIILFSGR